jgi:conjugative relaxase-like TrwC/TraI family protein
MLRVTTIHASSAGPSARYYTRYLADEGPEGEGRWRGGQAEALGLAGPVSTDALEALLSGRHPVSGVQLGAALVDRLDAKGRLIRAVAGFDATFSAPKSLSVWWGLTGDPGLLVAHDVAVAAVLDHLERFGSTTRVRVNGSRMHPDTGGLVMGVFRQATSREDDPQLHTHVVISTKVQTRDGRWLALDARYLKRKQRALGGLYQSVLRAELTRRYGVAWQPVVNGQAEIVGLPADLLEAFSKRTAQVDELLATKIAGFRDREGRDPSRWERAALTREAAADSRATKTHATTSDLSGRWADEAAALGWIPERLLSSMRTAARDAPNLAPAVAVNDVVELLSAKGSTWTRADVLQAVCDLAPAVSPSSGPEWARTLEHACDQVVASCVSLDPEAVRGPVRASDGRSVWLAPSEPHLTHERVLAQEERILSFALDATDAPSSPSTTVERVGLDVLQGEAAAAAAGVDRLVLVVGPAGTGKTTALRRAVEDLSAQHRAVFGVAPTAKAAKVLRDETGMPADTVAKLLHEWRSGHPGDEYRLPRGATVGVDEAGMLGTGNLHDLVRLAVSHQWRLVLVGDPRQLHAVGRGGMFDELCRTAPTHQLATIHRFRHRWEQQASLLLRAANPSVLNAYLAHGRINAGTFEQLAADIARQWVDHTAAGRTVAVVAETNAHVDALNRAIQAERRRLGQLGERTVRVAGNETVAVGDVVVTRRNDRTIRTDRGEPVRNRDRWTVAHVHRDGGLTVSHERGHGTVTLFAEYAASHVRLGYAATAHGHQGDTVDVSLAVITEATTHRSLYVGATRGRDHNQLLVVTDEPGHARDVLELVLTNDRADVPTTAQRRNLARQVPTSRLAEDAVATAMQNLGQARRAAEPLMQSLRAAESELRAAEQELGNRRRTLDHAPRWRRRGMAALVRDAADALETARANVEAVEGAAAPHTNRIEAAENDLRRAAYDASRARIWDQLRSAHLEASTATAERDGQVQHSGLGLEL